MNMTVNGGFMPSEAFLVQKIRLLRNLKIRNERKRSKERLMPTQTWTFTGNEGSYNVIINKKYLDRIS